MMNDWIFLVALGIGLVALVFVLLWYAEHSTRMFHEHALLDLQAQDALTLCYVDGLEEYADLIALLNADMHDALLDAQNEIRALHRQTVEIPARPKRTAKRKVVEDKAS